MITWASRFAEEVKRTNRGPRIRFYICAASRYQLIIPAHFHGNAQYEAKRPAKFNSCFSKERTEKARVHAPLFGSARESAASALRNMYNRAGGGSGEYRGGRRQVQRPDPPARSRPGKGIDLHALSTLHDKRGKAGA